MKAHMRTTELFHWIKERHSIYEKRRAGLPKPWTADPILQQYRFTNVYRELDTVTVWIANNWRNRRPADVADLPYSWFAMVVARLINWPDTLAELGYPVPWNSRRFVDVLRARAARGEKVFTGAYMISAGPDAGQDKATYLADKVLTPLWENRDKTTFRIAQGSALDDVQRILQSQNGLGSFMAAQVVADLKYTFPFTLATDWASFAASGPGSMRGLNWVCGREFEAHWNEQDFRAALATLKQIVDPWLVENQLPVMHAQDLQGCLCELHKYVKVQQGWGKPRQKYAGVADGPLQPGMFGG
jgi:hypothetical protein